MSCKQTIEDLCLRFGLSEATKESSKSKYELTSRHNCFSFTSRPTKTILSAVCLYLSVFEDHKPVTITQICGTIGCNINEFGRVYNQLIKEFPHLKNDSFSIEQLVEVTLKEANFDDTERPALTERVIQLIRIVRECWLIEGRSPVHIIFGTAFLGWKSLKPSVRSKVKLTEFCNIVSIDYKHTVSERVNEIFNALKKLGQKIPGKEKFRFNRQNISIYINEIIEYSHSLLFDLNNQFKSMTNSNDSSVNWVNAFKRRAYHDKSQTPGLFLLQNDGSSGSKRKDEEISDSEIDCYIRTKKEVKLIKKMKKLVESEEQEVEDEDEDECDASDPMESYIKIDGLF